MLYTNENSDVIAFLKSIKSQLSEENKNKCIEKFLVTFEKESKIQIEQRQNALVYSTILLDVSNANFQRCLSNIISLITSQT